MKRVIATAMIFGSLAMVGVTQAQAGDGENSGKDETSKACVDLKKADRAAFAATYGPKHAMKTCKKGSGVAADEITPGEFKNAAKECKAEREADPEGFHETYGDNENGKNALGKCVSQKVRADEEEPPAS